MSTQELEKYRDRVRRYDGDSISTESAAIWLKEVYLEYERSGKTLEDALLMHEKVGFLRGSFSLVAAREMEERVNAYDVTYERIPLREAIRLRAVDLVKTEREQEAERLREQLAKEREHDSQESRRMATERAERESEIKASQDRRKHADNETEAHLNKFKTKHPKDTRAADKIRANIALVRAGKRVTFSKKR